ncbi:EamA family transporter [Methylocella tundrae]|uniref:EamA family transporter n=1 Tax=Methylocella tundrae TaxID=227605 RepID=UPI001FCEAA13|nr:EamA family transporter [Methylocella tundrae]
MLHTSDAPLTTLFYTALVGAIFCAAFLPFVGVAPKPADLALMAFLGSLGVASHFCMIRAFAAAPANVVAPFGYTALLWATLFSVVIFAEIPGGADDDRNGPDRCGGSVDLLRPAIATEHIKNDRPDQRAHPRRKASRRRVDFQARRGTRRL